MNQFELIFDNSQPRFEQISSFFQEILTNPTFQEGIREVNDQENIVNDQERISEVNEMEKVCERSFQETRNIG